jgi:Domain of unknown function (DUF4340)
MSRQRLIALAVAALLAISAALFFSTQRNTSPNVHGSALLPSLGGELDTVSSLSVLKGSPTPTVTVQKRGDQWTVLERANYPADVSKVRKLLLALSDAKIREEKTSNPDNYSVIGVEDAVKPGATGSQIELIAKSGKLAVIVGKPVGQGNFVRRPAETTSYAAEPGISVETEPRFWIDTHLLDIASDKIQSLEFKPASGPGYVLRRVTESAPKTPDVKTPALAATAPGSPPAAGPPTPPPAAPPPISKFVLEGAPSGRQAAESATLTPSPNTMSSLSDDDVAAVGDVDFSKPTIVILTLTDGSVITLTGANVGEKRWIQVAAPKDASLTAKVNGRAFEIASYRYDQIFRPLEQLLVPKPTPPSAKPAPGSQAPLPGAPSSTKKPPTAPKP